MVFKFQAAMELQQDWARPGLSAAPPACPPPLPLSYVASSHDSWLEGRVRRGGRGKSGHRR